MLTFFAALKKLKHAIFLKSSPFFSSSVSKASLGRTDAAEQSIS
jgi:hypothetical protein